MTVNSDRVSLLGDGIESLPVKLSSKLVELSFKLVSGQVSVSSWSNGLRSEQIRVEQISSSGFSVLFSLSVDNSEKNGTIFKES